MKKEEHKLKHKLNFFLNLQLIIWTSNCIWLNCHFTVRQFLVLLRFQKKTLKMNLHSIRFSYVFVRFFTFLLLLDKVCAFSSAFLCVHIRTKGLFIKDVRTQGGGGVIDLRTRGEEGFWNADVHISTFSATENRRLFYSVFGFPGQCEPRIKRTVM